MLTHCIGSHMAMIGNVSPEKVNASTEYPPPIESDRRRFESSDTMNTAMAW